MSTFHLHTDIGHDPDDVIALSYLIEHGEVPTSVSISPGYKIQHEIVHRIFKEYGIESPSIYSSKTSTISPESKESKYQPGPHKVFLDNKDKLFLNTLIPNIECDKSLIIGPAINLGGRLITNLMVFQGGYSPNSVNPLEKFRGQMSAQSFNPSGAKKDFLELRDSKDIKKKYYVGKNVCHGWTKVQLSEEWMPSPKLIKEFYDNLSESKAMHDVLAAKMVVNHDIGIWENTSPSFCNGLQMNAINTNEEIYTLIGLSQNK